MVGKLSVVGKLQVNSPIRCMTDMAAAGPEFFSPVPELLRGWCFLGRYVDVCGIFDSSVNDNSSLRAFSGSVSLNRAFEEFRPRLRAASCMVDARRS
jgi:hypothetical protein